MARLAIRGAMFDRWRLLQIGALLVVAYVAAAKLGFRVALVAEQVTTVWPPTGLAEAALLLWGRSLWPAVWIGAFAINAQTHIPIWAAAAVATGNTLEALTAVSLLRRIKSFDPVLRRVRDAVAFVLIGGIGATALSATIGAATLCAAGVQPWPRFAALWTDWWLGDTVGAMIVAPALLTTIRIPWRRAHRANLETAAIVVGCALTTHLIFSRAFPTGQAHHPLEYVIFPFVVAAAVRLRQPATALVVLGASAVTIWNTIHSTGPFAAGDLHEGLILLQVFMGVLAGTGLLLAAALAEQKTGERRRAAGHAVAQVLARAPDLTSAGPEILRAICQELNWPFGALWLVDTEEGRLRCVAVWHDHTVAASFETATVDGRFAAGIGLPGRVWNSGTPAWIENVVEDANFPRALDARDAGLRGAFGFPICQGNEVLGVVECFNRVIAVPDPDLLRTMSTVGYQIGQFIARVDVEREREQLLTRESSARRDAEAANTAKDEFLANLSHELRTPLNAIVGWTRMLIDGRVDEAGTKRALEVIDRNARLQTQLVSDILDVSSIINGGLGLSLQPVDLRDVVYAALDVLGPAARAKRLDVRAELGASPCAVDGDPQRLQQVVLNLVSNAVKFTDDGGRIDIELDGRSSAGVQIQVRDNGVGIDPAFLPYVFERFRQADATVRRSYGGLGLGLAIVRHLVELHGGSVRAVSDGQGKGSTFTVHLPRAPVQQA